MTTMLQEGKTIDIHAVIENAGEHPLTQEQRELINVAANAAAHSGYMSGLVYVMRNIEKVVGIDENGSLETDFKDEDEEIAAAVMIGLHQFLSQELSGLADDYAKSIKREFGENPPVVETADA